MVTLSSVAVNSLSPETGAGSCTFLARFTWMLMSRLEGDF